MSRDRVDAENPLKKNRDPFKSAGPALCNRRNGTYSIGRLTHIEEQAARLEDRYASWTLTIDAMKKLVPRTLLALSLGLLLSCGGGGGGNGGTAFVGMSDPVIAQSSDTTPAQAPASQIEFGFKGADVSGGGPADGASGSSGAAGGTSTASAGDSSGVGSGGTGATASGGDNSGEDAQADLHVRAFIRTPS